jgi:hypothetical protein
MKSVILWALVIANTALMGSFLDRVIKPNYAAAQSPQRRAGDYLMIPADIAGQPSSIVYVLDQANGLMGAMAYDDSIGRLYVMPQSVDLSAVFQNVSQNNLPPGRKQ